MFYWNYVAHDNYLHDCRSACPVMVVVGIESKKVKFQKSLAVYMILAFVIQIKNLQNNFSGSYSKIVDFPLLSLFLPSY